MNDPLPLVIANLKANKTWDEVFLWLKEVGPLCAHFQGTVVFCPTSAFLASTFHEITLAPWKIKSGAQDISRFEQGAYTGETSASQIANLCQYVIVGHSERRKNFHEDEKILVEKITNATNAILKVIFCVQSPQDSIPQGVEIVAYEPTFAIGTGNPDTPQNVKAVAQKLKTKGDFTVVYGGSVSPENVQQFLQKDIVDGVLVGATSSLDPQKFIKILKNAIF